MIGASLPCDLLIDYGSQVQRITFYMQVYLEPDHGLETVTELRRWFPQARIVVYSDGGPDRGHLLRPFDVDYILSAERAFLRGCLAPHLMLERFLAEPASHLFKVDADTAVHREFRRPLPTDCVFGTLQFVGLSDESVQGGCMGFPVDVAAALHDSGLLLDRRLERGAPPTDDPHLLHLANRWRRLGVGSFDWSIAWACRQLAIPMRGFDEVRALWQRKPDFEPGDYALTHPRADKAVILDDPDASVILRHLREEETAAVD